MTAAPAPPLPARTRPATPAQLDWLAAELPLWRAAGLVDDRAATAILASYHPSRRFDLSRLLLTLGAAFVGVGILWLVASNLDQLPPLVRFAVVAAFWLAFLVGGELLAGRREHGYGGRHPLAGRRLRPDPRRPHVRGRGHAGGPEPAGAGVRAAAARLVGSRRPRPRVRRPRHRPARGRPARPRVVAGLADHVGRAERAHRAPGALRRRRGRRGRRRVARGPAAGVRRSVA